MSKITIDSEKIAEIRNALQVIQGITEAVSSIVCIGGLARSRMERISHQVKRIDKLLPQVKFEGGK